MTGLPLLLWLTGLSAALVAMGFWIDGKGGRLSFVGGAALWIPGLLLLSMVWIGARYVSH